MAYAHNLDYGVVKLDFNISPTAGHVLVAGDTVTVTGRVKCTAYNIKSIEFIIDDGAWTEYINKSISKGSYGSFSITTKLPQDIAAHFFNKPSQEGLEERLISIYFRVWSAANRGGSVENSNWMFGAFIILRTRERPTINSVELVDIHPPIYNNQTPYEYFGAYIQGESIPRFSVSFGTDVRNEKLTSEHNLVISTSRSESLKPMGDIIYETTVTAPELATSIDIDIPPFSNPSAWPHYWFLTTKDSSGMSSSTETGTLTVLPYTKPTISAYNLQRYRKVLDSPNVLADNGPYLWTTFAGSVASVENKNAWNLKLAYSVLDSNVTQEIVIDSDQNGRAINIAEDSTTDNDDVVIPQTITFDAANTYQVVATLSDMLNSISSSITVLKAGGYLDVEKTGVAVGQRSTSDSDHKKFEVNEDYISYFYGGINGVNNYESGEVKTGGHWIDGRDIYRAIFINTTSSTGSIKIGELSKTPSVVLSVNGSYFLSSDSIFRSLPFVSYANISWSASVAIKENREVYMYLGSSNSGSKNYVAIVDYVPVST